MSTKSHIAMTLARVCTCVTCLQTKTKEHRPFPVALLWRVWNKKKKKGGLHSPNNQSQSSGGICDCQRKIATNASM